MPRYKEVNARVKVAIPDHINSNTYRPIITETKYGNGEIQYSTSCRTNNEIVNATMSGIPLTDEEYDQAVALWSAYDEAKRRLQEVKTEINDFYRDKTYSELNYLMNKHKEK